MKIANADKLKKHFENVVDVKLFTPAQICTIIDTFSSEVNEEDLISREKLLERFAGKVRTIDENEHHFHYDENVIATISNAPSVFGGTEP